VPTGVPIDVLTLPRPAERLPTGRRQRRTLVSWPAAGWRGLSWVQRLLGGYYGLYVLWYFMSGATGEVRTFVSDVAYLPLGVAGVVLSVLAAVRVPHRRDRTVWLLIALALAFRTWGDGAWWWLEAVRHTAPFPSVADVGYFGFYPVLTVALAAMPVRPQSRRASVGNLLDVLAMVGGAFMVIWYLVLGAALQNGIDSLEQAINVGYPVWDLLLMLAGGRILLRGTDPRWTVRARWLITGALCFIVADIGFSYLSGLAGFTGGGWLDLFWIGALLFFALAAASRPRSGVVQESLLVRQVHLLPVAAIVASYAVVAKVGLHLPLFPVGGVLLIDLLITLVVVARQLVAVAEHRDLAARYRQTAVIDALTGVASRSHFLEQAEGVLARHHPDRCAVVMIDVDLFKTVNDVHGHLVGDTALQTVARHLQQTVRTGDLLGRFGGDEFVALLIDLDLDQAAAVIARMNDVHRLQVAGRPLSLSVGWACHGGTLTALLGRADTALYAAKAAGRGRAVAAHQLVAAPAAPALASAAATTLPTGWRGTRRTDFGAVGAEVIPPEPSDAPTATGTAARQQRELRAAITHDQLTLHYQPKIDVASGAVCGVEALVRWCHPEQGLRYPDTFLPLIESAGLMPALTDRVLALALDQLLAWQRDGLPLLTVAVNLSASSVTDPALPARIAAALGSRGLPGSVLTVEITEQCLINDRTQASHVLAGLRDHGVRISIDDFGTGYSSLAYLRDLPIDELKLDRAFIAPLADDARAAAIVRSTIELSHALGVPIVAEGVEDQTTCDELTRYRCDIVQGYHLARPMPPGQLAHWLEQRRTDQAAAPRST